ncbi:MAG: hypothetical protein L6R36_001231 [Xanthoria steineri]|nr:MAG: hypothetical protein L6R36_001231 [Xanthoria steineri]
MTPRAKDDNRAQSCSSTANEAKPYQGKRPPKKDLLRTVVVINVGTEDNRETFSTHRELLSFYSPYFRAMMNGSWEEAKTNIINLTADEPHIYEIFQNWLYGIDLDLDPPQARDISLMLRLWIFGDKVQVPGFQNAAIEGLRFATNEPPRVVRRSDVAAAFENSGEGSPLRKFIVDLYVWEGSLPGLMRKFLDESYPKAFIAQFFEGYVDAFPRCGAQTVKKNRPYGANAQRYYVPFPGSTVGRDPTAEATED